MKKNLLFCVFSGIFPLFRCDRAIDTEGIPRAWRVQKTPPLRVSALREGGSKKVILSNIEARLPLFLRPILILSPSLLRGKIKPRDPSSPPFPLRCSRLWRVPSLLRTLLPLSKGSIHLIFFRFFYGIKVLY